MLLTITTTRAPATDLGYLLHKHPDRLQAFPAAAGSVPFFYPRRRPTAAPPRCCHRPTLPVVHGQAMMANVRVSGANADR